VRLTNFGACLTGMHFPGRSGNIAGITLGFDELASYVSTRTYFWARCGGYSNRIAHSEFLLDEQRFQMTRDESPNHLHGGATGFDTQA
jgi:aldose 1-epimerase